MKEHKDKDAEQQIVQYVPEMIEMGQYGKVRPMNLNLRQFNVHCLLDFLLHSFQTYELA